MSMTEAYPRLIESLNDLRRQWRMKKVTEGVLLAIGGACAVVITVVAADNLLQMDTLGRLFLALVLWGTLAVALLGLVVRRCLEDRRDDFFAALVEQKHPELHNQLINALQLGRGNQNGHSPRLIEAIVDDAANATADLEMNNSLDSKPVKRASLLALVAVLAIAVYAAAFAPRFANGLARVLRPVADIPPYSATIVTIKGQGENVAEGEPISVEARLSGDVIPSSAKLHRRTSEGASWQSVAMQPDSTAADTFRFTVPQASESFEYFVTAGDGRSSKRRLQVVKRPQVENVGLVYKLPAYTAAKDRQLAKSDGEITGLPGTTVEVELKATKALKEATLSLEDGKVIALHQAGDARTWQGSLFLWNRILNLPVEYAGQPVTAPTRYQVKLRDTDGYDNGDPLWRSIALAKDQPPTVVLSAPGRDLQAQPGATVALAVKASDDYGLGEVRLYYRVNDERDQEGKPVERELAKFSYQQGPPKLEASSTHEWNLASQVQKQGSKKLEGGDVIQYWATASDRNTIPGPGLTRSRAFSIYLVNPEAVVKSMEPKIERYAEDLRDLVRLQRENRAQTTSGVEFVNLAKREIEIRARTGVLARAMEKDALPVRTIVTALDELVAGLMARAVKVLEQGRDTENAAKQKEHRTQSLPIQDQIIAELEALLARLERNEQAREALKKLAKTDKSGQQQITKVLSDLIKDMDRLLKDQNLIAGQFEKLPKKSVDEVKEDKLKAAEKELEEFQKKWKEWKKGAVNELTKLPEGFIKDFDMRPDVNKIFEEIEKAATRAKAEKMEVALEDLGAGLATKMKEDLEMWMPDSPDATKWVLEEPLDKKNMKIPEMPLPKALEDLVGDLLQKADEFDEEADDVTSAWGDNLDQAGWGVADGPISSFSAKGKTGNDLPNNMEVSGRSGEGRRGKSSGQMVGDTVKGLSGRKTPARVGNEKYEPGQLKQEGKDDPSGSTGGGKKSGSGRIGLQGGTPPDYVRDMERLGNKQDGLRKEAQQVAKKLEAMGINNKRLDESIELLKASAKDLGNKKYDDAARKRKVALGKLQTAFKDVDQTSAQLSRARDLPAQLRTELLQAADEGYPPGYENLLKSYFKALSETDK